MRKWAALGAVLSVLALLAAGSLDTVGRRSHYPRIDCGLYFRNRVMFGVPSPRYEPRPRTHWYDRRLAVPHGHRWSRWSCSAGLNVWAAADLRRVRHL